MNFIAILCYNVLIFLSKNVQNALIYAYFGVLIIRTMAAAPLTLSKWSPKEVQNLNFAWAPLDMTPSK